MLDPRIPDGLADINSAWTLDDLTHALEFIEQLDRAEALARAEAERARQR